MSSSLWADVGRVALVGAGAAAAWGVAGFATSRLIGRTNVVDTFWGAGFVWTGATSTIAAVALNAGNNLRRALLLSTVTVWGSRLSWYVGTRSSGKGEDPRYADLLAKGSGSPGARAITLVFAPQSLALWAVSLPLMVGPVVPGEVGVVGWLGVGVWAVGLTFEAVGDAQMKRFKADDDNHGKIADVGLWSYTRHPNYFGDAAVWAGVWMIAADAWPGVLTVVSPMLMTGLLAFGTGKRLLERKMRERDGWDDYAYNTSGFVPLPPGLHRRLVDLTSRS